MGNTGLELSVLSFGSWVTFHKQIDDTSSNRLMSLAYDNGINFFDNAEVYALGESERMMGRVLKSKDWERSSYLVSSKVFFGTHGGKNNKPNQRGLSRKHIMEACDEALRRLQLEYLDLYYCHRPDSTVPMEEIVRSMNTLIQQGKIFYWCTSEWSAAEIMEANMVAERLGLEGPKVEQPEYNMFNRNKLEAEFLNVFRTVGLGTTIWSPLASGLLTGKYNEGIPEGSRLAMEGFEWLKDKTLSDEKLARVKQLQKVADELDSSLATLSLAWCISNPNVTTAIVGATKESQLLENLKAVDLYPKITVEIKDEIDAIMGTKPIIISTL